MVGLLDEVQRAVASSEPHVDRLCAYVGAAPGALVSAYRAGIASNHLFCADARAVAVARMRGLVRDHKVTTGSPLKLLLLGGGSEASTLKALADDLTSGGEGGDGGGGGGGSSGGRGGPAVPAMHVTVRRHCGLGAHDWLPTNWTVDFQCANLNEYSIVAAIYQTGLFRYNPCHRLVSPAGIESAWR